MSCLTGILQNQPFEIGSPVYQLFFWRERISTLPVDKYVVLGQMCVLCEHHTVRGSYNLGIIALRASQTGPPTSPLYVRADSLDTARTKKQPPNRTPIPSPNVRAVWRPSNPAHMWGGFWAARTCPPLRTGPS